MGLLYSSIDRTILMYAIFLALIGASYPSVLMVSHRHWLALLMILFIRSDHLRSLDIIILFTP